MALKVQLKSRNCKIWHALCPSSLWRISLLAAASCLEQLARRVKRLAMASDECSSLVRQGSLLAMASDECRYGQTCYFSKIPMILMVLSFTLIPEFVLNII